MSIILTLIDERLIHGSVTSSWISYTKPKFLVLAHDETVNDPNKRMIMELAAPANISLSILTIEELGKKILNGAAEKGRVMLLLHNLRDLFRLMNMGVSFDTVNISHILHKPDRKERRLSYGVHVSKDEEVMLLEMIGEGIKFEVRPVPTYKSKDLLPLLKQTRI